MTTDDQLAHSQAMHKTAPGGADSSKRATPTSKPRTTTAAAQSANPPRAASASAANPLVAQALAQGFGPTVTDPVVLRRVARLLAEPLPAPRAVAA